LKKSHFFFIWLSFFTQVFCIQNAWAVMDTSKLTTKIDKSTVTIGEPMRLTCSGIMSKNQTIDWPQALQGLNGLSVVDSGFRQGFPLFGQKSFKGWHVLKGYEPGDFEIPSFNVKCIGPDGVERTLATEKIPVSIKSLVQGDAEKLDVKDIKGIHKVFPWRMLLGVITIILSLAAWLVYVSITVKKTAQELAPPIPAHILALEKLRALEQKDLIGRGLIAEFYFELSMIVRQYLEDRFLLRAPEMTTEEFLASLKESQALSSGHKQLLKEFLSQSDMVKFAKYGPQTEEIHASVSAAKKLIQETIPQ
jgi:hypothetical protein